MGSGVIEMAALGRPFKLGMLYDCRTEKLIPGVTLWDPARSEKNLVSQPRKSFHYDLVISDEFSEKAEQLNMNGNLKLSFLANLLELSGSANYLKDRTSSSDKKRATLKYKCTTKFESLSCQIGEDSPQSSKLINSNMATHVVTGILYGSQVFLVLDKQKNEENATGNNGFSLNSGSTSGEKGKEKNDHASADTNKEDKDQQTKEKETKGQENKQQETNEDEKSLLKSAYMLPILFNFFDFPPYVGGDGDYNLTESEKKIVDSTSIKFYGDFIPPSNPVTFEEAMELCKKLPTMIGQEESIPQKVWLFPLSHLDFWSTSHLKYEIDAETIHKTEVLFEQLHNYKNECTDFLNTPKCKMFAGLHRQVWAFRDILENYAIKLQSQLSNVVPKIRGGAIEKTELEKIIDQKDSPFEETALSSWLSRIHGQALFLSNFVKDLNDVELISEPGVLEEICFKNKYVVCLSILMAENDPFLQAMKAYMEKEEAQASEERLVTLNDDATKILKKNAKVFQRLSLSSKSMSATKFIIREEFSSDRSGGFIYLYQDGELKDTDYEPPGEPRNVQLSEIKLGKLKKTVYASPADQGSVNPSKVQMGHSEDTVHEPPAEPANVNLPAKPLEKESEKNSTSEKKEATITITWEPPCSGAEKVAGYEVHIPSEGYGTECLHKTNETTHELVVSHWNNTFLVKSCSKEGLGFLSNPVNICGVDFVPLPIDKEECKDYKRTWSEFF